MSMFADFSRAHALFGFIPCDMLYTPPHTHTPAAGSHITSNRVIRVWRMLHDPLAQRTDLLTGRVWQTTPTTTFTSAAEAAGIHLTLDCPSTRVHHVVKALHGKLFRSVRLAASTTERIILPYPGITAAYLSALCFPALAAPVVEVAPVAELVSASPSTHQHDTADSLAQVQANTAKTWQRLLAVVKQMRDHPTSAKATWFTNIGSMVTIDSAVKDMAREAGVIPIVMAALSDPQTDRETVAQGCTLLVKLTLENTANQTASFAAGGVPIVVAAVQAHPGDLQVARCGLRALEFLVKNHAQNQAALVALPGALDMVRAIKAHFSTNETVTRQCRAVLDAVRTPKVPI
jgi:hypothetical protein